MTTLDPTHVNTAFWLALAAQFLIPGLSALATRAPSALTGLITVALSSASGFIAEWGNTLANGGHYDWRAGATSAAIGLLFAWGAKARIYSGALENWLHAKVTPGEAVDISTLPPAKPLESAPAGNSLTEPGTSGQPAEHQGRHEAPEV